MSLPVSRDLTWTVKSQVPSATLNLIQDILTGRTPHFFDDFYSVDQAAAPSSTTRWEGLATGGSIGLGNGETTGQGHYANLTTGASTNNNASIITSAPIANPVDVPLKIRQRVRFPSDLTLRIDRFGLAFGTGTPDFHLAWERDTSVDTVVRLKVKGGAGVESFSTAWSPSVDTWYVFDLELADVDTVNWQILSAEGGTVLASGQETLASSVTSNASSFLYHYVQTLTTAARSHHVDYVSALAKRV